MTRPAATRDVTELNPVTRVYPESGGVPNHPTLPAVLVREAVLPGQDGHAVTALLKGNGWGGNWQGLIFDYQHYHPNAHEVLIVATGQARLQLGGPDGDIFDIAEGDVIVLPAGTGHCCLSRSRDFSVVGGYPTGQENYEIARAHAYPIEEAWGRILSVPTANRCPIFAETGPLITAWAG